ncbi:MAG: nucleotidyltransferase domain-containing protein [Chloroflexi bacterium]|nr:nucleotidyltransferase domain-containing protein [Chloroflexota bacterium]
MVVRQTGAIRRPRQAPLATLPAIQALAREIGQRFQPRQIVLFGSYATGHATPDSDVDLLVVMASPLSPLQQAAAIARAVAHPFPLDIIVCSPDAARAALAGDDDLLRAALTTGLCLYEAPDSGVG